MCPNNKKWGKKKKLLLTELILGEEGSDYDWGDGLF
jgi:hypothetical protein